MAETNNDIMDRMLVFDLHYRDGIPLSKIMRMCCRKNYKKNGFTCHRSMNFVRRWANENVNTSVCVEFLCVFVLFILLVSGNVLKQTKWRS